MAGHTLIKVYDWRFVAPSFALATLGALTAGMRGRGRGRCGMQLGGVPALASFICSGVIATNAHLAPPSHFERMRRRAGT